MLIHSSHSLRCIPASEVGAKGSIRAFRTFWPMPFRPIEPPWLAERRERCLLSLSCDAFLPSRERRNVVSFILCIPAIHSASEVVAKSANRAFQQCLSTPWCHPPGGKARVPECGLIHSLHSEETLLTPSGAPFTRSWEKGLIGAKPRLVDAAQGLEEAPSPPRSSGHLGGQLVGCFCTPRPGDGLHAVACQRLDHGFRHPLSSIVQDRVSA